MSELKKCSCCGLDIKWDDDVILVKDEIYLKDCVVLYTSGYVAYIDGEFIGETDNDDGSMACEILDEGEYVDEC